MKKLLNTLMAGALLASMVLTSCSDISADDENSDKAENYTETPILENINSEIVLGEKIENIFTLEAAQARAAEGEQIEANYMYFRCRTEDETAQKWLSEKFDFLSIVPLDREIVEGGTIYKDPDLSENESPWYYFMKPIEDYNDVVEHGLIVEVIEEMYLDDEDIALLSAEGLEIPEDTYLTVNVEEESARFGGWIKRKIKKLIKKYVANCPHGNVKVYDTIINDYVPVKNVQIISHQLGVPGIAFTNGDGKFNIPVPYTSLGGKVQIIVRFSNSNITVNSINKATVITGALDYYEGSHWVEGISDLSIRFSDDSKNAEASTILNAYSDYCDYCSKNSVRKPTNINVCMTNTIKGAMTPLFRYATSEIPSGLNTGISSLTGFTIPSLNLSLAPDIIVGTKSMNGSNYTEKIYQLMFHELSHASHYFGLGGNGQRLWLREYRDMIKGWIEQGNMDAIESDPYNKGGTDLVKLIESWGYFSENYIMAWRYPTSSFKKREPINYIDKLERRLLDSYGVSNKYFYYGGFYDLIDNNNESGIDFCYGYKYTELFKALTSSNVTNLNGFANALVNNTNRKTDLQNVIKTLNANHN